MKPLTIPLVAALGFTGIEQASAAVEAYTFPMNDYVIVAFVGATPAEVAQAQRLAKRWEAQRHQMLKPQSMKAVFIHQSPTGALTQTELRRAAIAAAQAQMP